MSSLKISLLVIILSINISAQWEWQNGMPPRQNILKIFYVNYEIIFAIGEKGLIIKTTDNGINWYPQTSNTEFTLRDISFINYEIGYAIGDSGLVLKTENGGNDWIIKETGINSNLNAIYILGTDNSWIGGDNGAIMFTPDGGETWQFQNSEITSKITDIHFSDYNYGCAIGYDGSTLYTSNGGNNWGLQIHNGYDYKSFDFIDGDKGYAVSLSYSYYPFLEIQNNIWKTTDKGNTWNILHNILETIFKDIKFLSEQTGFIAGYGLTAGIDYGLILKTVNGGFNWEQVFTGSLDNQVNTIAFNNNNGIAVTMYGEMYSTSNFGDDWSLMYEDKFYGYLRSADFENINTGWIVGNTGLGDQSISVVLKTSNGGINWHEKLRLIDSPLTSIFFIDLYNGWLGGHNGFLYKSTNGGETWIDFSLDSLVTIGDIFFINENIGWLVQGWSLKKTIDGGNSWFTLDAFQTSINKIFFIDENYGWLTKHEYNLGRILRTTNGGNDWIPSSDSSNYGMNEVYFLNRSYGWAVAGGILSPGEIWTTNNGGVNWELNLDGYDGSLQSVYFVDSLTGFVCGASGTILNTTNGGINWKKYITNTSNTLNHIKFVDESTGWIIGNGGIILKTTNGGSTFVSKDYLPIGFSLSQNYPNPFNPSTKIKYSIPHSSKVIIKVFDILGNEIESLVNEEKPSGTYEVEFNATGLPSGVYFYQLKAGSYVETKKMILLK